MAVSDRTLDQAYSLALFIVPDEAAAEQIVREALAKLEVTAGVQQKRSYYRPRSGVARTKVTFSIPHLLQRLIYIESERFEREREAGEATNRDFLVSFLKHLVRCALKRNSFYAAVAISRILHNYTTVECMNIYNLLIQDPDQYKEEDYYRSRKAVLMDEIEQRFADRVRLCKGSRSEERLETQPTTDELVQLVRESLLRFTPWETHCLLPGQFNPLHEELEMFKDSSETSGVVEVRRFHALFHPECLEGITRNLQLDDSARRLEVPRFFVAKDGNMNQQSRKRKGNYDPGAVRKSVLASNESRRNVALQYLNIWVDGKLAGMLDTCAQAEVTLKLLEGAEMVEVRTTKEEGEILLAVHLLDSTIPQQVEMGLPRRRAVIFRTQPAADGIVCDVRLESASLAGRIADLWRQWLGRNSSSLAWKVALPSALAAVILLVLWNYPGHKASPTTVALNAPPVASASKSAQDNGQNPVRRSPEIYGETPSAAPITRGMDATAHKELKTIRKIALDLPPDTEPPNAAFSGIMITNDRDEAEALLHVSPDESGKRLVSELRNEDGKVLWTASASCRASENDTQSDCRNPAARTRTLETLLRYLANATAKAQRP